MSSNESLSRREREIMDVVFELTSATVADLLKRLPDPPTDGAIRTMLGRLETKGLLRKGSDGNRATWSATTSRNRAQRTAVKKLLKTFFEGSVEQAVSAMLANPRNVDDEELDRLSALIEAKRRRNK